MSKMKCDTCYVIQVNFEGYHFQFNRHDEGLKRHIYMKVVRDMAFYFK